MSDKPSSAGLDYSKASYFTSAPTLGQCPPDDAREAAFVGRSNAGKSSAINTLTRQTGLARTSKTPGRTQLLNFFAVAPDRYLVDLPGFGYAKVPPAMKRQWQTQIEKYLRERRSLRGLVLLMDIRHPFRDFDQQMLDWARLSGLPLHILLTKADKLKRGPAQSALLQARRRLESYGEGFTVQLFSSLKGVGVEELKRTLDSWLCGHGEALPEERPGTPQGDEAGEDGVGEAGPPGETGRT